MAIPWEQLVCPGVDPVVMSKDRNVSASLKGFLHIRRGDTMEECDTNIPALRAYLLCSLANMTFPKPPKDGGGQQHMATRDYTKQQQQHVGITLLVGTNEEDAGYMQDLLNMVKELSIQAVDWNGHPIQLNVVNAINMESLIWEYLQAQIAQGIIPSSFLNNLHVFEILEHIMNNRVDFKLSRRRFRFCNDCDKIVIRQSAMQNL
ncbi:MAG: hypothetical protein SGARI_007758 [Bacillariaceae sp.]